MDQSGLATAVAQLLGGAPPREALRQFGMKYGQFGGPEHSPLGLALLDYQSWLKAHRLPHDADRFRDWVNQEYLIHSFPAEPGDSRSRGGLIARGALESLIAR
jgi:hypothetical protein